MNSEQTLLTLFTERLRDAAAQELAAHAKAEAKVRRAADAARAAAEAAELRRIAAIAEHGPRYWEAVGHAVAEREATDADADQLTTMLAALDVPAADFLADVERLRAYFGWCAKRDVLPIDRASQGVYDEPADIARGLAATARALLARGCPLVAASDGGWLSAPRDPSRHPVAPIEREDNRPTVFTSNRAEHLAPIPQLGDEASPKVVCKRYRDATPKGLEPADVNLTGVLPEGEA